jgi:hypothetical protein
MPEFTLRDICHVCKNDDGDRFVGIRADAGSVAVYFPLGYQLPPVTENERELRRDIARLILVLAAFTEQKDKLLAVKQSSAPQSADFPVSAYMAVIADYMARSYYTETEWKYAAGDSGKIDWRRTMRRHQPMIQSNGSPVYTKFEVRNFAPNDRTLITRVHEFCVYEAFQKLGWLFSSEILRRPQLKLEGNKNMFIGVIRDKMGRTFIDNDKQLFQNMLDMLNYLDERSPQNRYCFGTDNFEYVWQRLIDKAFGVKNKRDFFPHAFWRYLPEHGSSAQRRDALQPDTIMIADAGGRERVFVLDAKYYRFGATGIASHLPEASSIHKQITYGEYVSTKTEYSGEDAVFNAFIMPYNRNGNPLGLNGELECIGEARGDWKPNLSSYEAVQGIVVDTRYLMYHYAGNTAPQMKRMAETILAAFKHHRALDAAGRS